MSANSRCNCSGVWPVCAMMNGVFGSMGLTLTSSDLIAESNKRILGTRIAPPVRVVRRQEGRHHKAESGETEGRRKRGLAPHLGRCIAVYKRGRTGTLQEQGAQRHQKGEDCANHLSWRRRWIPTRVLSCSIKPTSYQTAKQI